MWEENWSRYEKNEDSWFSLWSENVTLGPAKLLVNPIFSDDPLFNHVTIDIRSKSISDIELLTKIISYFAEKNIPPSLYIMPSQMSLVSFRSLENKGFYLYDRLLTLSFDTSSQLAQPCEDTITMQNDDHLENWVKVFTQSFSMNTRSLPEILHIVQKVSKFDLCTFYGVLAADKIAGVAAGYSNDNVGGVYCLGVLPAFRQKGLASKLLRRVLYDLSSKGNKFLCLQTLAKDNLVGFYRRIGFVPKYNKMIYTRYITM